MSICEELFEPTDAQRGLRMALWLAARTEARNLERCKKVERPRLVLARRQWLIEMLEVCKTVGEWFWRDVLDEVRKEMQREAKP